MLAKKYRAMAREIEWLNGEEWRQLKNAGYEYGVKLAEMIDSHLIDSLSARGKQVLTETYEHAKKNGFIKVTVTKVH